MPSSLPWRSPLVSMDALRKRPVLLGALTVQLLTYPGAFGTSLLFALYLQEAKGWSAAKAGRLLIISPVFMACFAPVAGRMAERIRPSCSRQEEEQQREAHWTESLAVGSRPFVKSAIRKYDTRWTFDMEQVDLQDGQYWAVREARTPYGTVQPPKSASKPLSDPNSRRNAQGMLQAGTVAVLLQPGKGPGNNA